MVSVSEVGVYVIATSPASPTGVSPDPDSQNSNPGPQHPPSQYAATQQTHSDIHRGIRTNRTYHTVAPSVSLVSSGTKRYPHRAFAPWKLHAARADAMFAYVTLTAGVDLRSHRSPLSLASKYLRRMHDTNCPVTFSSLRTAVLVPTDCCFRTYEVSILYPKNPVPTGSTSRRVRRMVKSPVS